MEKKPLQSVIEYSEQNFTKRVIYNVGGSTVFMLNFMPGQQLPTHKHPGTEVFLLVVTGSGTFTINGKDTEVTANDTIHSAGYEELAFRNTGETPASLYVMLNKVPDERYVQNI